MTIQSKQSTEDVIQHYIDSKSRNDSCFANDLAKRLPGHIVYAYANGTYSGNTELQLRYSEMTYKNTELGLDHPNAALINLMVTKKEGEFSRMNDEELHMAAESMGIVENLPEIIPENRPEIIQLLTDKTFETDPDLKNVGLLMSLDELKGIAISKGISSNEQNKTLNNLGGAGFIYFASDQPLQAFIHEKVGRYGSRRKARVFYISLGNSPYEFIVNSNGSLGWTGIPLPEYIEELFPSDI